MVEYIGVTMDETERIRANAAAQEAQAELARVARLTTMGELAASIAHEINQPLAAVIASGNAALRWLAHARPIWKRQGKRLTPSSSRVSRQRSDRAHASRFSGIAKPEYVELDINDAIREVLGLTGHALRSRDVLVQTQLPAATSARAGRPSSIAAGYNESHHERRRRDERQLSNRPRILQHRISTSMSANSVLVCVRDAGTGIDEAIRERIFEPLFTTKSTGMGMGLSICRSIVEAHGGCLWVSPAKPYGADFQFTIPISRGAADPT